MISILVAPRSCNIHKKHKRYNDNFQFLKLFSSVAENVNCGLRGEAMGSLKSDGFIQFGALNVLNNFYGNNL